MKWSKGWFTLVALAAALGVSLAVLVPLLVQREIDQQVARRLSAAAAGADAEVQLHARRWIDTAGHAAFDKQLAEALDHASTGSANIDQLHVTAQERLRSFQKDWREWKPWQVIAVDAHARVMARVGAHDDRWKDDLSAAHVVTEALKGFQLDDTWLEDGRLLKVVAAPVTVRDRYAGAVLVVVDLAAELAQPLADRLGAEVVFAAGGKGLGHSAGAPVVDGALAEVKRRGSDGEPIPLPSDGGAHVLMARPLPGTAAPQAQVVVVAESPRIASVGALRARLLAAAGSGGRRLWFSLLPVGIGLLATLLLGWFVIGREQGAPLERLLRNLQAVVRGDSTRLDDTGLGARHAAIARAVNSLLDRARAARPPSLEVPTAARGAGGGGPGIVLQPEIPPDPFANITSLPPPPGAHPSASQHTSSPLVPKSTPISSYGSVPPAFGAQSSASFAGSSSGSLPGPSSFGGSSLSPPPSLLEPPLESGPLSYPSPASTPSFAPAPPPRGAGYVPLDPPMSPTSHGGPLGSLDDYPGMPTDDDRSGSMSAAMGPGPSAPPVLDPVDEEFQAVFHDFIDTRQRCGEPIEGITFERFAAKLRGNRDQLLTRFGCKGVKFQVYVKDGKAALKATPTN